MIKTRFFDRPGLLGLSRRRITIRQNAKLERSLSTDTCHTTNSVLDTWAVFENLSVGRVIIVILLHARLQLIMGRGQMQE
jgi:hypothetical protein